MYQTFFLPNNEQKKNIVFGTHPLISIEPILLKMYIKKI